MSAKSRGNFRISWDNGRSPDDYHNGRRYSISYGGSTTTNNYGIKVMTNEASDGSKLDRPISQSYMKNIKSRRVDDIKKYGRVLPSHYGSGKKVPRD